MRPKHRKSKGLTTRVDDGRRSGDLRTSIIAGLCTETEYRIPPRRGECWKKGKMVPTRKHQAPGRLLMSSQEILTRRMTYDTSENHRVRRKAGVCQFERHKRPSGAVANNQALRRPTQPSAEPWHHESWMPWNARTSSSTRRLIGTCATVVHLRELKQLTQLH